MTTMIENKTNGATDLDSCPVVKIRLDQITPDLRNRKNHDQVKIEDLAADIERDGLLQPIVVRASSSAGHYLIIAGERRYLAHKHLRREEIAARVAPVSSELVAVRMRAAENLHRENLSPLEEAEVLRELADGGMTQKEIAEFVGKGSQSTVANTLRLLELPQYVKELIGSGELSRAHGVALCRFNAWPKVCESIARSAIDDRESAKGLEREKLPYAWSLESKKLAFNLRSYQGYKWTKEMAKSPHWLNLGHAFFCLDKETFEATKRAQDLEIEKAVKKEKARAVSASDGASADRAKVRAKNAAKRKEIETTIAAAVENLKKDDDLCLKVIIQAQLDQSFRKEEVSAVAPKMGLKLPQKLAKGLGSASEAWDALGGKQVVRLVAASLVLGAGDYAKRNLIEPDTVVTLAAKTSKAKAKK